MKRDSKNGVTVLSRRDFLKAAGAGAMTLAMGGLSVGRASGENARKPNVVVIVGDDLGYMDLGVQGCKDISTPNIDSIAKNGIRFTNGYVSCPVCSPTRAGLMTGRYQQRFGHEFNPGPPEAAEDNFGLPLTETTFAARMKAAGYATGCFGKWHLGYKPEFHPQKRGFDEFFGFTAGAHGYLDTGAKTPNVILRGTEPVKEIDYTTDAFAREAVAFIEKHKDEPFFVYLPFNAVHTPLQAPEKYMSRCSSITDKKRQTFAAMLTAMDDGVGSVLNKLRELGLEENTLIFFISDNGGPTKGNTSRNDPLRGFKGDVLEGGIRVPYMVQWKCCLSKGKVYDMPVIQLDILPTAIAAAGGDITGDKKLDGVNLLPYLAGENSGIPHDTLFWRYGAQWAVRKGDWKLFKARDGKVELHNLAEDVSEKNNLFEKEPEKVKELQAAYDAWNAQLAKPAWKGRAAVLKAKAQNSGNANVRKKRANRRKNQQ